MNKSRHLSYYKYFEQLQLEYICCELRRKIYQERKDKDYYIRVAKGKRAKIEDIANKNRLPSIFSSPELEYEYYEKICGVSGLPNFLYRDENEKLEKEEKDIFYYFLPSKEVRIDVDGNIVVGIIEKYDNINEIVTVNYNDKLIEYKQNNVTRVL